jgi:hypothetical protein
MRLRLGVIAYAAELPYAYRKGWEASCPISLPQSIWPALPASIRKRTGRHYETLISLGITTTKDGLSK